VLESATKGASALGKKGVDLGKVKDVADYVLRTQEDGYETASTSAASDIDPSDAEQTVKLSQDYVGRNNAKGSKRAIKLDEIGPRMEMRLIKIVEGVPGKEGGVIYHEFGAFILFIVSSTFSKVSLFCRDS
jgi:ribosome biogenesis protein SSF1/2